MAWPIGFLQRIRQRGVTRRPRYVLEGFDAPGFGDQGGTLRLSSHDEGPYYSPVIASTGHSFGVGQVTPGEWSSVVSSLRIATTAKVDYRPQVRRGQLVQLRVGFPGVPLSQYAAVHTGILQDVVQDGAGWAVNVRGLIGALSSRFNDADGADSDTFSVLPATTTLSANYTAGDANVQVSSTADATRETGGKYLIQLTAASGATFFLTATGTAAGPTRFTGVSAGGQIGTTAVNVTAGPALNVAFGAIVEDDPLDVVRKLLASYDGTNGAYDTLPYEWGMGFPDALFDHNDIDAMRQVVNPGGGTTWQWYTLDRITNIVEALDAMLGPAGLFLCERQGELTVRFGTATYNDNIEAFSINEHDIVSLDAYNSYMTSAPVEYGAFRTTTADGASSTLTEPITSRPVLGLATTTLSYIGANLANWRTFVNARTGPWRTRVGESVSLTLAGWRYAEICPGSQVSILCRSLVPRQRHADAPWLVTSCQPNWFGCTTALTAVRVPERSDDT